MYRICLFRKLRIDYDRNAKNDTIPSFPSSKEFQMQRVLEVLFSLWGGAEDWTQGFANAQQVFCYKPVSPAPEQDVLHLIFF